jgi:hypothetical protein
MFSHHIDPDKSTIFFYGAEIKKDEIVSVTREDAIRGKIVGILLLVSFFYFIYDWYNKGISFEVVGVVLGLLLLFLFLEIVWGRRVVITLRNGSRHRSSLLTWPVAKKAIKEIGEIL